MEEIPMRRFRYFSALALVFLLVACTHKETSQASSTDSTAPHATISLRDGSTVSGAVTSNTPSAITLNTDGGGTRTILTRDVKSVDYNTAPPQPAPQALNQPEPAPGPAPQPQPQAQPQPQPITFEIPAGTNITVRNDETIDSGRAAEGQTYAAK